jgi:flagellar hook-associated protein 1
LDEFERTVLKPVIDDVAALAEEIATRVNTQMAAGFAMDGTPGTNLFQFDAASTGLLKVVDGLLGEDLAFSSDPTKPGNSDNLQALIGLRDLPLTVPSLGTVRLGDVYTQIVGRLGTQNQQARAAHDTAKTVRNQAEESWKSTSGVNTDEEAINIVQYQQMYQANMKVLAVSNELFDSTLAMFG